jgi:hypothetical protein
VRRDGFGVRHADSSLPIDSGGSTGTLARNPHGVHQHTCGASRRGGRWSYIDRRLPGGAPTGSISAGPGPDGNEGAVRAVSSQVLVRAP